MRDDRLLAWILSLLAGCAGALAIFPVPVLLGVGDYWQDPHGFVSGSWGDTATAVSGYTAFAREAWQWPLFHISSLGGATGTNVIFTDSTPLLALLGRVFFQLTGEVAPLYGPWAGLSVVGMALASTALVRSLGARTWAAGLASALIGVSMPALLARWGHLSLMGQWVIPLALAAYVRLHQQARLGFGRAILTVTGLSALALLIHPYLFLMVAAVLFTVPLQAALTRRMRALETLSVIGGAAAALAAILGAMGYFSQASLEPARGFGSFSMNLLSPFLPQMSGVLPLGPDFILDGTGGQYEGFSYLGVGLLLLLLLIRRRLVGVGWTSHPFLLAVMLGFTMLAVSNQVYAAEFHIFTVPLPDAVLQLLGVVRASGRLIWLPLYLLAGFTVALAARLPWAQPILLLAAALQWAEAAPLRGRVWATMMRSEAAALDSGAFVAALAGVDRVVLDPPWMCMPDAPEWFYHVGIQVQLMTSRAGRETNTVYAARGRAECTIPALSKRMLLLQLHTEKPEHIPDECQASAEITACSTALDPALLRRLTRVRTDFE